MIEQLQKRIQADLRPGEKAYPIYHINVRWSETLGDQKDLPPRFFEGLPEDRFWNGTCWESMEREDRDLEEIKAKIASEWWPPYAEKKLKEPADLTIEVKLTGRDVWCAGWFSHWTFDVGMSDVDLLGSFERYVERILYSGLPENEIGSRLMGAEDRWRWHGCVTGDPQGERTEPPCRCPQCRSGGRVRIDH